jgi:glucose-1-phosphate adenylyltransferase
MSIDSIRAQRYTSVILAGGVGNRLSPLTLDRAKPAVPFAGKYRIIDFVLTNCVNSGLRRVLVLTQYKAQSLLQHIAMGWNVYSPEFGEFIYPVPSQLRIGESWYRGTADAVFQSLSHLDDFSPEHVVILSGDHIYRMDYGPMADFHEESGADVTLACLPYPRSESSRFGIAEVDADNRVTAFHEKPANPPAIPGQEDLSLVNMGIYIFKYATLRKLLEEEAVRENTSHDFGKDILPRMVAEGYNVKSWQAEFRHEPPYWRDIGTIDSYYEATMDLVAVVPDFNLYDPEWPFRTYQGQYPPAKTVFGEDNRTGAAIESIVSGGVIISGGTVYRSVLGPECRIHSWSRVEDSVLFSKVDIGRHCKIRRCIIDKGVRVPPNTVIGYDVQKDRERFHVSEAGVVVIGKGYEFRS